MDTARDISIIFDDPTYSDLVVKVDGTQYHCHKCIVFSASDRLRSMCIYNAHVGGQDEILLSDRYTKESIEQVMLFMYGTREADLFGDGPDPDAFINICIAAHDFGLPKLLKMGVSCLRLALEGWVEDPRYLVYCIGWMRHDETDVPELSALADEVEIEQMPFMLGNDEARASMDGGTIRAFLARVLIMKKEDATEMMPLR